MLDKFDIKAGILFKIIWNYGKIFFCGIRGGRLPVPAFALYQETLKNQAYQHKVSFLIP